MPEAQNKLQTLVARLERILPTLEAMAAQGQIQDHYSTADTARILGRDPYTVRQWCRFDRVRAEKRQSGRGRSREWMISHSELMRIKAEGLLPLKGTTSRPSSGSEKRVSREKGEGR